MIQLTRLNQSSITLNALYIEKLESTPDTVITLTTGRKVHVLESTEEVANKVTAFYQRINLLSTLQKPNGTE
jgi:flagellar protein FlbD